MSISKSNNLEPPPRRVQLPVIQKLVAAYKQWQESLLHIPKTSRYTLGVKIDALFLEVINHSFAAVYDSRNRVAEISRAIFKLDSLKFLLQVAWEIKALDIKKYVTLSEKIHEAGMMLGGWKRMNEKRTPPHGAGE